MLKFTGIEINLNWVEFEEVKTSISNEFGTGDIHAFYNNQTKNITVTTGRKMEKAVISVVNIMGQSFYKSVFTGTDKTLINASGWASGLYFLTVSNQNEKHTFKLKID